MSPSTRILLFAFSSSTCIGISAQTWISSKSPALSNNPNDVQFILFNTNNQTFELFNKGDVQNARAAGFLDGVPLVVLIGGFYTNFSESEGFVKFLANGLFASRVKQFNIVGVNWDRLNGVNVRLFGVFSNLFVPLYYTGVMTNIEVVGSRIANFMHYINMEFGISFQEMHIVGHSMGSHVAGAAGKYIQSRYREALGRISGLDPAGPGFEISPLPRTIHKLSKTDADFVDIYHSNQDTLGDFERYTGHVNIFVNGGNDQPGCEELDAKGITSSNDLLIGWCSHTYAWVFFKNSMAQDRKYFACPCSGTACNCKTCFSNGCSDSVLVGMWISKRLRGDYLVRAEDPLGLLTQTQ